MQKNKLPQRIKLEPGVYKILNPDGKDKYFFEKSEKKSPFTKFYMEHEIELRDIQYNEWRYV